MESKIKEYGYGVLGRRSCSIKEFEEKLKKKFIDEDLSEDLSVEKKENLENSIEKIISSFIEKGYLNDEDYVKSYIETHKYGYNKFKFIFQQKGIEESIYENILGENKERELEEIIKNWKKFGKKPKEKKIASLMGKGFLYNDIKKALEQFDD